MRRLESTPTLRAFLGRRWGCGAGEHSRGITGLESHVPPAVSGGGGLRPAGAFAGEGRA